MAVEDEKLYDEFVSALDRQMKRKAFYDAVVGKYPPDHPLVTINKAKLDEAEAELNRVTDKL